MMRSRPEMNLEHPPGQATYRDNPRYLRDVIKKYQEEEGFKPLEDPQATSPSASAEKRLEGLLGALAMLCEEARSLQAYVATCDIENVIEYYGKT